MASSSLTLYEQIDAEQALVSSRSRVPDVKGFIVKLLGFSGPLVPSSLVEGFS